MYTIYRGYHVAAGDIKHIVPDEQSYLGLFSLHMFFAYLSSLVPAFNELQETMFSAFPTQYNINRSFIKSEKIVVVLY